MKKIKKLITYLRHHKEIDAHYSYSLKIGGANDEDLNWYGRTEYWEHCLWMG